MAEPASAAPLAYEHNGRRVTAERFYAIACDPRRSVAVEACAGAGKTWMLVSRILRALLEGAQPHEILAITFTKKAAGEMRSRLHQWLAAFAQATPAQLHQELVLRGITPAPGQNIAVLLQNLYQTLLDNGRPVQIRTFHSWFAALLRNAPLATLEALGLPAGQELLEDDSEAVARVWRRFHAAVLDDPRARADYEACVAAHGRGQTLKALEGALSKRTEFTLADAHGVPEASVKTWQAQFPDLALPGADEPAALLCQPGAVWEALVAAARALGRASQPSFSALGVQLEQAVSAGDLDAALLALLTAKHEPRKLSDKLAGIEHIRAAQQLALRLRGAVIQHQAWLHQQRMVRLTRLLVAQYAQLKREHGWVDMNDVEQAALTMLSDPVLSGWVQERLDARVRHLLIDEFQDTNPLQWQALYAWLSGYAGSGGGDTPSVFIVGDPKQSIYRFRRAEPQVFEAAKAFVREGLEGDLLACDHTRRNAPAVLAAVNGVMGAAQQRGEYTAFRAHTTHSGAVGRVLALPAVPRPAGAPDDEAGAAGDAAAAWRDSLATPRELAEERPVALECRQAARWIAARVAGGALAPRDFMVLARKRNRLVTMEEELRRLRIPAQQPEKTDLCEAPEVQDLVALVDVLVSPTHDLSLARVLKSPLVGADDAALAELAVRARAAREQGQGTSWFELLQKQELDSVCLSGRGAVFARWKAWVDRLTPHDALDAIYHDGDVLARYAQAAPPALRGVVLANLRALLGAALELGGGRFATPYALVRALRAGGQKVPAVAAADAVQLLTVHGAKGLEAPVVLLLDTDAGPAKAETMGVIVDWPGEEAAPVRFTFLAKESEPPPCNAQALARERAERQREELNALYVAMTRAERELVVSSHVPHRAQDTSWWRRLQPLCEAVEADACGTDVAAAEAAADAAQAFELPVVPGAASGPALPPALAPGAQTASLQARIGQAAHRLLELWQPGQSGCSPALLQRVGREYLLPHSAMDQAAAMALRITQGDGAWAWDPAQVDWAGNEVELLHDAQPLRLDRLVRHTATGQWWVLDHKSAAQPERDEALLAQLRQYRQAVQAAMPGAEVKAAFLTGQGRLVPVDD